jgi:hypothetical protein
LRWKLPPGPPMCKPAASLAQVVEACAAARSRQRLWLQLPSPAGCVRGRPPCQPLLIHTNIQRLLLFWPPCASPARAPLLTSPPAPPPHTHTHSPLPIRTTNPHLAAPQPTGTYLTRAPSATRTATSPSFTSTTAAPPRPTASRSCRCRWNTMQRWAPCCAVPTLCCTCCACCARCARCSVGCFSCPGMHQAGRLHAWGWWEGGRLAGWAQSRQRSVRR